MAIAIHLGMTIATHVGLVLVLFATGHAAVANGNQGAADQDVYAATIGFVRDWGHDVVTAAKLRLSQADDSELLRIAKELGRMYITRDRDFGGLVFVRGDGPGVIYLRVPRSTLNAVHLELATVLTAYTEEQLRESFIVSSPAGIDFGKCRLSENRQ